MSGIRKILLLVVCTLLPLWLQAQSFSISGTVTDKSTGEPVEFATIVVEASEQWAVADAKGRFTISNIRVKKSVLSVSCLGYVSDSKEINITKNIENYKVALAPDNLTLENAVVTAREDGNSATTARTIDKTALEHVQLMNVSDISSLLPGGATESNNLTSAKQFNIRAGAASEGGNSSFGTAVEVDGVRLSNNASFAEASTTNNSVKGVSTNNIASSNVESVEVITGVPSVEYGDMASGVVKINTKKGKTPWTVTMSTSPSTKQVSASKGFGLGSWASGASRGVLNTSVEYTRSIADPMSPYTAYDRKQASLTWSNLFNTGAFASAPLRVTLGVSGNLGGKNTTADPDAIQGTWSIARDNTVRANMSLNWLLSKSWITNVELTGSMAYSDKLLRESSYYSSAINKTVLHGTEKGFSIAVPYMEGTTPPVMYIPSGYWFNVMGDDNRPLTSRVTLKANWARNFGQVNNKLKIGADWSCDYNFGTGQFSEDMATAPTFREYRYCDTPAMNNIGAYLEDNLMVPIGSGRLNVIAGIRSDNTLVKGSDYGFVNSFSPRFNVKYTVVGSQGRGRKFLRELAFRGSWGVAVKLPSYSILFPMPTYRDVCVFTSSTNSANESYLAYYYEPRKVEYNPELRWQRNRLSEVGLEMNLAGNKISLVGFWNRTMDAYSLAADYNRTSYAYTPTSSLSGLQIPADDRSFTIDPQTGIVTAHDKTGKLPSVELAHQDYKELATKYYPYNENSPIDRWGVEWVVDFAQIKPIYTSIRVDGTWYRYRSVSSSIVAYAPLTLRSAQDGMPFPYIGYYYGDNAVSNGSESATVRNNITFTTHIPKVRMIFTVKLESTLLRYSRTLSETLGGEELAFAISDRADILSTTGESIYAGDNFVVRYPQYYCTYDDPTPRDYLADLKAAREAGDQKLFNDLWQLSYRTTVLYTFAKDYISPYFSANFSVTKEIGDFASISFYANNFFNNKAQIYSTKSRTYLSSASYIPKFYYGLTLRVKF